MKTTLQKVVRRQLLAHDLHLSDLLAKYPTASFDDIRQEIVLRTGVELSARTVRRWYEELEKVAS